MSVIEKQGKVNGCQSPVSKYLKICAGNSLTARIACMHCIALHCTHCIACIDSEKLAGCVFTRVSVIARGVKNFAHILLKVTHSHVLI